jgi:uncharacterized protein (DUF1684 family)
MFPHSWVSRLQTGTCCNLLLWALLALLPWLATASETARDETASSHEQQVLEWRANRDTGLRKENGWLSLVGLEWLKPGMNSLGSGAGNSAHIPGQLEYWGEIELTENGMVFRPAPGSGVQVDGATVREAVLLADNSEAAPTVVSHGTTSFHVIFRESYGLRISDSQAPARLEFKGVENYDIQQQWLVKGRFIPAETGTTIEIGNVLGQLLDMPVFGYFEFAMDGKPHRLAALGEEGDTSLWFIFADRTSGRETYGAGRFLYSNGMPADGSLLVDFNKAYNPPCAFNDYSTCPLPPLENRLDLRVTAGEKNFHAVRSVN